MQVVLMIKFLMIIILLVALLVLGPEISDQQGFVHISVANYIIEMSVVSAAIILIILMFVFYLVVCGFKRIYGAKKGFISWLYKSKKDKSNKLLENCLISYINGNYIDCVSQAKNASKCTDIPLISSYFQLLALSALGVQEKSEEILLSLQNSKCDPYILLLLRTQMYLKSHDYQNAFNVITGIRKEYKINKVISKMFYESCLGLNKIDLIEHNRKEFLKFEVMDKTDYNNLIVKKIVNEIKCLSDVYVIKKMLSTIPADLLSNFEVIMSISEQLNKLGEKKESQKLLFKQFKDSSDYISIYESLKNWQTSDPVIVSYLENIKQKNMDMDQSIVELDLALANMYLQEGLFVKSIELYKKILSSDPSDEVYSKYGFCVKKMMEQKCCD